MIAFDIYINDEHLCKAGIKREYGILTSILSWSKRDVSGLPEEARKKVPSEELKITIGGQERINENEQDNIQWKGKLLNIGDEIRIKIVDSSDFDEPQFRNQRKT